jgi:hypothetical protein
VCEISVAGSVLLLAACGQTPGTSDVVATDARADTTARSDASDVAIDASSLDASDAPPIDVAADLSALDGGDGESDGAADGDLDGSDATTPADIVMGTDTPPTLDVPLPMTCDGGGGSISGTVYAPNGTDPIPGVVVMLLPDASTLPPIPTGVSCDRCLRTSAALSVATSASDGTFALTGPALDAGGTYTVAIISGGWRRILRGVTVDPCGHVSLTASQTSFAHASAGEDVVPRIAVAGFHPTRSTGDVNDHFVTVLDAIGITSYDTFDPDRSGTPVTTGPDIATLLSNASMLNSYQVVVLPCGAMGNFRVLPHVTATIRTNIQNWLQAGGRLYVSDLAYELLANPFPAGINWAPGPSPTPTNDPAICGVGIAAGSSIPGTIDSPALLDWLRATGVTTGTTIPIVELRDPWGAMDSLPASETTPDSMGIVHGRNIVSGDVSWYPGPTPAAHHPLTVQVDYPGTDLSYCGRVVYSSYHVQSTRTGTSLSPQERVLEWLFFQLTTCVGQ